MNTTKMTKKALAEAIQITHPLLNKTGCIDYAEEITLFGVDDYSKRVLDVYMTLETTPTWKLNQIKVCNNPDYIHLQISAINKELDKDNPHTQYIRTKIKNLSEWMDEIDKAKQRAEEKDY